MGCEHVDFTCGPTHLDDTDLDRQVLDWITDNPGVDAEDVATHFGIQDVHACDLVERLLNKGELGFVGED